MNDPVSQYIQKEFEELQYDLGRKYEDMPEEVAEQLILQLRQQTQGSVDEDADGSRMPYAERIGRALAEKGVKYSSENENEIVSLIADEMEAQGASKKSINHYLSYDEDFLGDVLDFLPREESRMGESTERRAPAKKKTVEEEKAVKIKPTKIKASKISAEKITPIKERKKVVAESVEQKLSFRDMMKLVVESGGQQQIDPVDQELFAWANRVAKSKLGEGMKAEVYAGMVYERMGGRFEMYDVLSESNKNIVESTRPSIEEVQEVLSQAGFSKEEVRGLLRFALSSGIQRDAGPNFRKMLKTLNAQGINLFDLEGA
jgi:hypothetical protein